MAGMRLFKPQCPAVPGAYRVWREKGGGRRGVSKLARSPPSPFFLPTSSSTAVDDLFVDFSAISLLA